MLDEHNALVKSLAKEKLVDSDDSVKLRLIGKRGRDERRYNLPVASEVAALIVGDLDENICDRDIIVEYRSGQLKRIDELHPAYLPLQYPLLYPYGEDGYRDDIPFSESKASLGFARKKISPKEYFSYYLHDRLNSMSLILYSRRLFQQFIVDAYTMVEAGRLKYVRSHQKTLRCDLYKGLADALLSGETDGSRLGMRVLLPSSYTGGARYMIQSYQDAMAICRWAGYPDLFITFTCNPKWPEILRYVQSRGLKLEDRPNKLFGDVVAGNLFLGKANKYPEPADNDKITSSEILEP